MSNPAAPRKRAARGHGAALRGEVLAAAMDLLRETGSEESMSLRAVAARVGVSVPSIYLHFMDKQALLDAVCAEVFEQLHEALTAASSDAPDAFARLRRQGVAYIHFALAHPEHYRIVMMIGPSMHDPSEGIALGAFGYVLETVTACAGLGVLEGDPLQLSLQLWAGVHGVASLMIAKPKFPWPPVEEFVDDCVCAAGLGLALRSRIPDDLDPTELVTRLDRLR